MAKLTEDDDIKIRNMYLIDKMSSTEIAKYFNVTHRTILNHLRDSGVKRRNLVESQFNYRKKEIPSEFFDYETMYDLYITQHYTKEQLGMLFNCAPRIKERDGFKCQLCHSEDNLHVHHKYPFADILRDIIEENKDLDPERDKYKLYEIIINDKRFTDENNLITYCKDCHQYKIHGYTRQS